MRWWNWLLLPAPVLLIAIAVRANWAAGWSASTGAMFSAFAIISCFLIGMAGICFTSMASSTRAIAGITYAVICPFAMMLAGIFAACSIGDCL